MNGHYVGLEQYKVFFKRDLKLVMEGKYPFGMITKLG